MKFHMSRDWQFQLRIVTDAHADVANFEVRIGP
jgi:hypothetical protein